MLAMTRCKKPSVAPESKKTRHYSNTKSSSRHPLFFIHKHHEGFTISRKKSKNFSPYAATSRRRAPPKTGKETEMHIFVETERFFLRELLPYDADGLFELDADPEVHRYLGNRPISSREQAADVIHFIRKQYADNGIGRWAVIDKQTHDFIGWSGLKLVTEKTNGHINYYDLGYRLRRKYWGMGIATETAAASLAYAFNTLEATEVFGMADCDNIASNKILSKVGLQFVEAFDHEEVRHNWYRADRTAFKHMQNNI